MSLVSFLILKEVPDKSMKPAFSGAEATARLFELLLTLTPLQQFGTSTCLRNPSQCCDTSSTCSSIRILLCSTPPVVLEVPCERLSRLVRSMCSGSRSTVILLNSPDEPSNN